MSKRETYYAEMYGKDYKKIKFDDIFGDTQVVGKLLEESDNLMVRVMGLRGKPIWFLTSKKAVENIKPMYNCTYEDSMRDVDIASRWMQLSAMGCPCRGVCAYGAIRTLLHAGAQIITVLETVAKSKWLVSHEVLIDGESVIGEAHCQEGTQQTIYATLCLM